MRNRNVRRIRSAGFTLVELLLAFTLMGMLLALAYGGFRAATRAADRGQAILEDSSRIRMAHQFVRKQLSQMTPLAFDESELAEGNQRVVFLGEADRIRYVAPMPGYLGFGGPQVQELAIVRGPDSLELVLSHALLQGFEEGDLEQNPPILLLDDIASAEFMFLGRDEEGALLPWTNHWDLPELIPESVALEIEFEEEVYLGWPLLTSSVRTDPAALAELAGDMAARPGYNATIRDMINRRRSED